MAGSVASPREQNVVLREQVRQLQQALAPVALLPGHWRLTTTKERLLRAIRAVGPNLPLHERAMLALYAMWEDAPEQKLLDVLVCKIRRKLMEAQAQIRIERIDWIITGGETDQGPHRAGPTHPDWLRQIPDACAASDVPHHHEQNGEWADAGSVPGEILKDFDVRGVTGDGVVRLGKKAAGRLLDGVEHNGFPGPLAPADALDVAGAA